MKKLLLLLLSVILFTSCDEEPEDINKYKGCVVMKKVPVSTDDSYDILHIKLTPTLKKSQLDKNNVHGDFYRLVVYKLDSKDLNIGDTIK